MLALVTGQGALPAAVAAAQAQRPLVCALAGNDPDGLQPDISFRIEHLATFMETLKVKAVTELCLCGTIVRPQIDPSQIDAATRPLVPKIAKAITRGEDSALRAVIGLFEQAGFTVRAAHELAPELIPPQGMLSRAMLPDDAHSDVAAALRVSASQGVADLGEACIIRGGAGLARGKKDELKFSPPPPAPARSRTLSDAASNLSSRFSVASHRTRRRVISASFSRRPARREMASFWAL